MTDFDDLLISFFQHQIFLGPILLLVIEEAGIPLPVENIIFTYMGYEVGKGHIPFLLGYLLILTATAIGSSFLYYLSLKYGQKLIFKLDKYTDLNHERLAKIEGWFRKYGVLVIIFGRHIPGFRVPITVFSGLSKIRYPIFLLCTLLSDVFTVPFYMTLGMKLGPKAIHSFRLHQWPFISLVVLIVIILGFYFFTRSSKKEKKNKI